ncbi:ArsR family transcriptional regulator [Candidatus Woesearchaeota archaeon]|nr:ArsR family transcriptional regulator [Candidatus Woesearchaeota archaeon]
MEGSNNKRTFDELREIILRDLTQSQKTINQISSETGINWKTVENHLTFLVGKGLAREIFSSKFVRIFEATEKGQAAANGGQQDNSQFEKTGEVKIG